MKPSYRVEKIFLRSVDHNALQSVENIACLMLTLKRKMMKRFNVKFHGENFLLNLDGEFKKFGFYATSFIKAETPQEAQKIATILIHQNPNLRDTVLNVNADRPRLNIEEIEEVNFLKSFAQKSTTRFKFYPEDEK